MTFEKARSAKLDTSPLWNRALERYKDELSENDAYNEVLSEPGSIQDVLDYAAGVEKCFPQSSSTLLSFKRFGPTLRFLDDFSAMMAIFFGADFKATTLIWGSIRLILSLASTAGDKLQNVLEMLEDLSFNLPEFRSYERNLQMTPALESCLVGLYTEIICFYARMIYFFRRNPHVALQRQAWSDFETDFRSTLRRITRMSTRVRNEADVSRMNMDKGRFKEVLDLVIDMKGTTLVQQATNATTAKHYIVPQDPDIRFSGREEALAEIHKILDDTNKDHDLRTFSLFGMGGVGKTQVALQYAKQVRSSYDVIIWIAAENAYSLGQTARDAGQALNLFTTEAENKDINGAMTRLRDWLRNTDSRWLLILDNADDIEIVQQIWPSSGAGSILLTSRDFASAFNPASAGYHVQPFDESTGAATLLRILGRDEQDAQERRLASEIVNILGGLPLAINQIASFIQQRKLQLKDFPALYDKNASKVDDKKSRLTRYEKTLGNVWELSLSKLSNDAAHLHGLIVFFSPDVIDEAMLIDGGSAVTDEDFAFLTDDMDLGNAEETLLQAALIDKSPADQHISVHRLVQAAVMRRATSSDRVKYLSAAIQILRQIFVGTGEDADIVNFLKAWTTERWLRHERCLPHVIHLIRQCKKYNVQARDEDELISLLIPCEIFARERELFDLSEEINNFAIEFIENKSGLNYAAILFKNGLNKLYTSRINEAIECFKGGIAIRERLLGPDHPLVAWGYNNLGLCYTELGLHSDALTNLNAALEMRERNDVSCIGNSYINLASLHLKMGRLEEAERYLFSCPSLQNLTDDLLLSKDNPRFAGDMVLLSRIRHAQGRRDDALRLASKALVYRRRLLGNRFTTCDSMHDVAVLLMEDKTTYGTALSILQELVSITEGFIGMGGQGQLARAYYQLSVLYACLDDKTKSQTYRDKALALAKKLSPDTYEANSEEISFDKLCPWMLW